MGKKDVYALPGRGTALYLPRKPHSPFALLCYEHPDLGQVLPSSCLEVWLRKMTSTVLISAFFP